MCNLNERKFEVVKHVTAVLSNFRVTQQGGRWLEPETVFKNARKHTVGPEKRDF